MSASPLGYRVADRVIQFMGSDEIAQQTAGMEPEEFRAFLAEDLSAVIAGDPVPPVTRAGDVGGEDGAPSTITHQIALQVLERAPVPIRAVYRTARKHGKTAAEALEAAMEAYRIAQEEAALNQVA